jgi:D-alanyl-D-alanine carboxypeptidase
VWTDGGLATTGADLARFANALVAGDLLSPTTRAELLRFRERGYGRGIFRIRFDGRTVVGHDGLYEGFTAQHWTDPTSGVTVAVLTNAQTRGGDPSWEIWKRLWRTAAR